MSEGWGPAGQGGASPPSLPVPATWRGAHGLCHFPGCAAGSCSSEQGRRGGGPVMGPWGSAQPGSGGPPTSPQPAPTLRARASHPAQHGVLGTLTLSLGTHGAGGREGVRTPEEDAPLPPARPGARPLSCVPGLHPPLWPLARAQAVGAGATAGCRRPGQGRAHASFWGCSAGPWYGGVGLPAGGLPHLLRSRPRGHPRPVPAGGPGPAAATALEHWPSHCAAAPGVPTATEAGKRWPVLAGAAAPLAVLVLGGTSQGFVTSES